MRLEFHLLATSPGESDARIIRETTHDVIESVLRLARHTSGAEPEWAVFFSDPEHRDWPLDRAVAALNGMREAVSTHGAAWAADRRWVSSCGEPEEFVEWLDGAIQDVRSQPAGARFQSSVQPD